MLAMAPQRRCMKLGAETVRRAHHARGGGGGGVWANEELSVCNHDTEATALGREGLNDPEAGVKAGDEETCPG